MSRTEDDRPRQKVRQRMTDHNVSTTDGDIHATDDDIDATDHVQHRNYNRPGIIDQLWKKNRHDRPDAIEMSRKNGHDR